MGDEFYVSLLDVLEKVPDPRDNRGKRHPLTSILIIVVIGFFCNLISVSMIALVAREKRRWFKAKFGIQAIPSRDTIRRCIARIDSESLTNVLCSWIAQYLPVWGHQIAIDGKAVRGAADKVNGGRSPYNVNVQDVTDDVTLYQIPVNGKTNEMATIIKLLDRICLTGALVSMDAAGLEVNITDKLAGQMADFLISLKGNQETLMHHVAALFEDGVSENVTSSIETEKANGRITVRTTRVIALEKDQVVPGWPQIRCVASVHRRWRYSNLEECCSEEDGLYVSSRVMSAEEFAKCIRRHWRIEGTLHGTLDGSAFYEDRSRSKVGNSVANLSMLRKLVLTMIRLDPLATRGRSIAEKMNIYRLNPNRIAALLSMSHPFKRQRKTG